MEILKKKSGIMLIQQYENEYIRYGSGLGHIMQIKITKEQCSQIINDYITMESVVNYYDNRMMYSEEEWRDLIVKDYLIYVYKLSKERMEKTLKKLKKYGDIYFEFYDFVLDERFPREDAIEVEGYTAEKLYNTTGLSPLGAYNYLVDLRETPKDAINDLNANLPVKQEN